MERVARLGNARGRGQARVAGFCLLLSLALTALLTGCTRRYYRTQADQEVGHVLDEKDRFAAWKIENYHVYPDPRARFADPTSPDRPPMPPDDPAARETAPQPQRPGKAGIALVEGTGYLELLAAWDAENRAELAAEAARKRESEQGAGPASGLVTAAPSPSEPASGFAVTEHGSTLPECHDPFARKEPFLVKIEQAVELGLINSREYQDRREDLYLVALPVTLERFSFTAQFFATQEAIRERTGRLTPEGQHNRWRLASGTGFTKLFSTGALLLFRFANQTVIELTGRAPKHTISESTALLELTQPLLRGGGRAVTLEPLTQVERSLLYEIRDYARFRKQFFVAIAGGGDLPAGGVGGFGGLDLRGSGQAPSEGYLPTLLRTAQIVNERKNVTAFEDFLRRFNAFYQGGEIGKVNVDQIEQQLLSARFTVSQRETDYRDSLDRLKLQLGVPVPLRLELDDTPLDPMNRQLQRFEEVVRHYREAKEVAERLAPLELLMGEHFSRTLLVPAAPLPGPLAALPGLFSQPLTAGALAPGVRRHLRQLATDSPLTRGTKFATEIEQRWQFWENLPAEKRSAQLRVLFAERNRLRDIQAGLETQRKVIPEELRLGLEALDSEIDLAALIELLAEYEAAKWRTITNPVRRQREHAVKLGEVVSQLVKILGGARTERLGSVQQSWAALPSVCVNEVDLLKADLDLAQDTVAQTALVSRFDLMNQRALLTDAWRKIAVFANSLLGTFNVQYHLDSATPPGLAQPLAFSGSRSRHQLRLNTELPLVRQSERNAYRASLIAFQRSRRTLMEAEDNVVASVRQQVRQLRLLAENYKIQQRQVELAYAQVEQSLESFTQPATPPSGQVVGPPGGGSGAGNAAALTQQLITAQRSLNLAQNQLYAVWINFLVARMTLYRDLELLPLDFRGVWNDEHASCCGPDQPGDAQRPGERRDGGQAGEPERLPQPSKQPPAGQTQPE